MSRGRKKLELNSRELQVAIDKVELSENPPQNRTELWRAVAATEWAQTIGKKGLSPQMAANKAEEFNLVIKTPKGPRGKSPGQGPPKKIPGTPQKPKRKFTREGELAIAKKFKDLGDKTVDGILSCRAKFAIKAMCYECSGYSKIEVARCAIESCPLHPLRPWKRVRSSMKNSSTDPNFDPNES